MVSRPLSCLVTVASASAAGPVCAEAWPAPDPSATNVIAAALLQGILVFLAVHDAEDVCRVGRRRDVGGGRIGAPSFRERQLLGARARQRTNQAVVPLKTPGLLVHPI